MCRDTLLCVCIYTHIYMYVSGEGSGTPLQYSCLENGMDGGAWWAAVHGVARSRTRLNDFTFTFHFHALEKEMATHSSVLAWRIPGIGGPSGLPSMGSHRLGYDWSDLAAAAAEKKWQTTPVRLLGESHGQKSLEGYSPWCCKKSDMTEGQSAKPLLNNVYKVLSYTLLN